MALARARIEALEAFVRDAEKWEAGAPPKVPRLVFTLGGYYSGDRLRLWGHVNSPPVDFTMPGHSAANQRRRRDVNAFRWGAAHAFDFGGVLTPATVGDLLGSPADDARALYGDWRTVLARVNQYVAAKKAERRSE